MKREVFIVGSKGIPARYGGFETFVENLTKGRKSNRISYHIACMNASQKEFLYNRAMCFSVRVPKIGPAKAIWYDIAALHYCVKKIRKNKIQNPCVYVLACRIGPVIRHYKRQIQKANGILMVNPDGHEWKRKKWNWLIQRYWKFSERLMIKWADRVVCDSMQIEKYILQTYASYYPDTRYLAYGAYLDIGASVKRVLISHWFEKNNIKKQKYYLIVGRFVPDNNYETIIREFLNTNTDKELLIVTDIKKNKFYKNLLKNTQFEKDGRVRFVGAIYDPELLYEVRKQAFAYIHGHEVGGTNPSLLEALACTKLNLLLNVTFNYEVAGDTAMYWEKEEGSLSNLINQIDSLKESYCNEIGLLTRQRIKEKYSWESIISGYEKLFIETI